jgi:hypothetical protein
VGPIVGIPTPHTIPTVELDWDFVSLR